MTAPTDAETTPPKSATKADGERARGLLSAAVRLERGTLAPPIGHIDDAEPAILVYLDADGIAAALAAERAMEKERIAHSFEGSDTSPTGMYEPEIANTIRAGGK